MILENKKIFYPVALFFVIAIGVTARLFHLGKQSLWIDEAYSFWVASQSIHQIFFILHGDNHPPFFYLFLHFWGKGGASEFYLRLPSAFLGVCNIILIFITGKNLVGKKTGLFAAFLWATSFFVIDLETQVRWYACVTFFSLLSTYLFIRADTRREMHYWILYAVVSGVAIYCQYYAGFITFSHLIYLAFKQKWHIISVISLVLFLEAIPWAPIFLSQLHGMPKPPALGWIDLPNVFSMQLGTYWFLGEDRFYEHLAIALFFLGLIAWGFVRLWKAKNEHTLLLILLFTLPLFLPLFLTILDLARIFYPRYLIVSLPYAFIVLASLPSRSFLTKPWPLFLMSIFGFINLSIWFFSGTGFSLERQSWHEATSFLKSHMMGGDVIVVDQAMNLYPLAYYMPENLRVSLQGKSLIVEAPFLGKPQAWYPVGKNVQLSFIEQALASAPRFWLVLCQDQSIGNRRERKSLIWFLSRHQTRGHWIFRGRDPIEIFLLGYRKVTNKGKVDEFKKQKIIIDEIKLF